MITADGSALLKDFTLKYAASNRSECLVCNVKIDKVLFVANPNIKIQTFFHLKFERRERSE